MSRFLSNFYSFFFKFNLNFPNLKIIFSSFVFFFKLGKNWIGGSVKQKSKFLQAYIVHLMASGITTSYCTDRGLFGKVELKRKKCIVSTPLHNTGYRDLQIVSMYLGLVLAG